ncbi:MAG TPA: RNA polymerase-binding protein DksA [Burkholderiaceae bacterium]|nr:RNA polymerase-binding protein DksA [Burkholderiaceae bacterium]
MAAKAKSPVKKAAKPAKTAAPKKASKPAKAPVAKKAAKPAAKHAAPAPAPRVAARPASRPPARPAAPSARPGPVASVSALPTPTPVAKPSPQRSVSAQDLAAATEYLLNRSATRSEAPIVVNGKKLPTEEELLRMADSDYMNESQLAFFKHRLQEIERELLANADETTEHLRETVIVPDPADRATIEEEHALELRTRDRERKLLKKVQSSLARIEAGEYGFCEETGDPIGIPRLLARPTATLSLEAQQRREMKQKLYGD